MSDLDTSVVITLPFINVCRMFSHSFEVHIENIISRIECPKRDFYLIFSLTCDSTAVEPSNTYLLAFEGRRSLKRFCYYYGGDGSVTFFKDYPDFNREVFIQRSYFVMAERSMSSERNVYWMSYLSIQRK